MVTADDVDTLLFDVLGTMVDEAGSMRAELAAALDQAGAGPQTEALATAWARRFEDLVSSIRQGAPWRSTDDLNAEALADVLREGPQLPEATVRHLALAGHRLRPWPDAQAALGRLARRFTTVALSNGNLSMLTDLFASAGLTWHCVLSGRWWRPTSPTPPCTGSRWTAWRSTRAARSWSPPTPGTCAPPRPRGCAPRTYNARVKVLQRRRTRSTSQPPA
jgi:2-haloacid dehalogenase